MYIEKCREAILRWLGHVEKCREAILRWLGHCM